MKLVIDLQGAQSENRFRGIGRYSFNLARAIVRNAGADQVWLLINGRFTESALAIRHGFRNLLPPEQICLFDVPGSIMAADPANAWRCRAAELIREDFLMLLNPDIVLVPSFFEGFFDDGVTSIGPSDLQQKTAIVIHDLIPLQNPDYYLLSDLEDRWYHDKLKMINQAGLLLANSEQTRQEAIDYFVKAKDEVINIGAAAEEIFKPLAIDQGEREKILKRLGISRPFLLYCGGFDQRKNLDNLLQAYALLPAQIRAKHSLVLAGKITSGDRFRLKREVHRAGLKSDDVLITDYLTDEDLVYLYNLCRLFVFPSRQEGFGLPPLEAMACGAPVIGSNCSSIPEVIGFEEALFDPFMPSSIAELMNKALTSSIFRHKLVEHGTRQVQNFSWDASAQRALSAFDNYLKGDNFRTGQVVPPAGEFFPSETDLEGVPGKVAAIESKIEPEKEDLIATAAAVARHKAFIRDEPKLYVDASELARRDAGTGIQRVVREVLSCLLNEPPAGYQVVPIYEDKGQYYQADKLRNRLLNENKKITIERAVLFQPKDIFLGLDLAADRLPLIATAFQQMRALGMKVYFVVYDILGILRPDCFPPGTRERIYKPWLETIALNADGLFCISQAVAFEVSAWLADNTPDRPDLPRVDYFHLGADFKPGQVSSGLGKKDEQFLKTLVGKEPFFLMVGTIEPRKGHAQTLSAFELLWQRNCPASLVIVGRKGWMVEKLAKRLWNHPLQGKKLFWIDGADDALLLELFQKASALLAPSEGEGFGLPLIEAAHNNLPVVARDLPVFREIAGEHAYYFSGYEPKDLADAILQWLRLWEENKVPASTEMCWLTWRESTDQLKELIFNRS